MKATVMSALLCAVLASAASAADGPCDDRAVIDRGLKAVHGVLNLLPGPKASRDAPDAIVAEGLVDQLDELRAVAEAAREALRDRQAHDKIVKYRRSIVNLTTDFLAEMDRYRIVYRERPVAEKRIEAIRRARPRGG